MHCSPATAHATDLRAEIHRRISDGKLELPMIPRVASELLDGGLAARADLGEISALLHEDQAITGHVLRIANSAAFGGAGRIQSIQQALLRIGLTQLREIVLTVVAQSRVFRVQGFEPMLAELWRHSAVAGAYARAIARALRVNAESAFLCGLLHDVGKPVTLALVHDLVRSLSSDTCLEVLEPHHAAVGRALAERWGLPPPIVAAITYHHEPTAAAGHAPAAHVTSLANLLAHLVLDRPDSDEAVRTHPSCAALNLYPDDVDALIAEREAMLAVADGLTV
jgi:putative nucleotidyltransferase with HDIG domain